MNAPIAEKCHKVHKIGWMAALLAGALVLGACGHRGEVLSNPARKPITIYVIGYQQDSAFWSAEQQGAEQAARDFHVNVRYEAPQHASTQGMIQLSAAAIAAHPYGLLLDYLDHGMYAPTLRALNAGIHVVLYNNNLFYPRAGGATTNSRVTQLPYVGQDNAPGPHGSGAVLMAAFMRYLQPHAHLLVLNPFPQAFVSTMRFAGIQAVAASHGMPVSQLVVNGDEAHNEPIIGAYLQAHPHIGGIIGLGTPAANPAAFYVSRHHLHIPIAAFDVDEVAYDNIREGKIQVALDQQPFLQAYLGVLDLTLEARYGFHPVDINTGNDIVDQANIGQLRRTIQQGKG